MAIKLNKNAKVTLGKNVQISIGFISSSTLPPLPQGSFYFTLGSDSTTSAGVYDVTGSLVRTIWNNVTYSAGTHTGSWNGNNDSGVPVVGSTTIKVVSSNIQYEWDATIGNSSIPPTGSTKIRALRSVWDIAEIGNYIYYCTGYVEGASPLNKWLKNDLSYMTQVRPTTNNDFVAETRNIDYDTSTGILYCDGQDPYADQGSNINAFIYAITSSNESDYNFPSGSTITMSLAYQTYRAIGVVTSNTSSTITGLAVMSTGSYLYSTHKAQNLTKVYNKTSGQLLNSSSLSLADITIEGNHLYGISGSYVVKYSINTGTGALTTTNVSMSFSDPLRVSIKNNILLVADGDTSQQIKAYNDSGSFLWTYGQAGGYVNSPSASNNKFHFRDYNELYYKAVIFQQADNSFWIGDSGNNRVMHVDSNRNHLETVSYLPMNYNVAVNLHDPNRVFAGFTEYNASTGQLSANWQGNLTGSNSNYINIYQRYIFDNLINISGRTFGTINYYPEGMFDDSMRQPEIVELSSTGIRLTGIRWDAFSSDILDINGDIISFPYNEGTSGTQNLTRRPYNGLDGSNNPTWGSTQVITSVPLAAQSPSQFNASRPSPNGVIFSPLWQNSGSHFGRVENGSYNWKSSYSTAINYTGNFPTDGTFDCGNSIPEFGGYAGGNTNTTGSLSVWNYIGEGWKQSQVNIWQLYENNYGLLLKQIGKTTPQAIIDSGTSDAPAQAAGNAFSGKLVKSGSNYVIYHNDESVHGAIHRFRITGVDTIAEQTVTPY
jgi:hypothetical protein